MDKSWIDLRNRKSREYVEGINQFIAFTSGLDYKHINCPCRKCANRYYYTREIVQEHLIMNGFLKHYKNWIKHGEEYVSFRREERVKMKADNATGDQMMAKLNDIASGLAPKDLSHETNKAGGSNSRSGVCEKALRYFESLDDAQTELYPGCKDFSKLSFIVELLNLKESNQWSDTSFDMLLQLLRRVLPSGAKIAESYYHTPVVTQTVCVPTDAEIDKLVQARMEQTRKDLWEALCEKVRKEVVVEVEERAEAKMEARLVEMKTWMEAQLVEMKTCMEAQLAEREVRLYHSRGAPVDIHDPPLTQAPDAGSGHQVRPESSGEGNHDPADSNDQDQVYVV